jgi:hypothetical protein
LYQFEFALPRQKVDRIKVTMQDNDLQSSGTGTLGVDYMGVVVKYKPQRGSKRLASAFRS